jgi:hypothetical protein
MNTWKNAILVSIITALTFLTVTPAVKAADPAYLKP